MIAVKVILVVIFVVLAIRIMYMIKQGKSKLSDDERFVVTKISIGIVAIIVSVSAFIVGLILGLYVFTWLGIIAITVPEFLLFAVLTFLFWPKELVRKKEETFVLASP
jgi:amino acid transporter